MLVYLVIAILGLGILVYQLSKEKALSSILRKEVKEFEIQLKDSQTVNKKFEDRINSLQRAISEKDELFETIREQKKETFAKISSLYSDFLLLQYDISSRYLTVKSRPAYKEARRIDDLKLETKAYIEQYRQMVYKYEYLLQLFPELADYVDDMETIMSLADVSDLKSLEDEFDRAQFYVSTEEFQGLSMNDRNQLALNRYISGQKSKWQVGRDYEMFCGHEYEKSGWSVEYIGIEKKLNDMGRDIIAKKGNEHLIVQCKYWSKEKLIHEKHITQLFGTTIEYAFDRTDIKVTPVLITNIELSSTAKKFAETLGVEIRELQPLNDFPRIKCNINRDEFGNESKIYHLPFDQQYDKTKICKRGEFYAFTVNEASEAGFRRAFKYFGAH